MSEEPTNSIALEKLLVAMESDTRSAAKVLEADIRAARLKLSTMEGRLESMNTVIAATLRIRQALADLKQPPASVPKQEAGDLAR